MTVETEITSAGPAKSGRHQASRNGALAELLDAAGRGDFPSPDGRTRVLPSSIPDQAAVVSFEAHTLVAAEVSQAWVDEWLADGDLSAPLNPPFLSALSARLGRQVNGLDMLLTANAAEGDPPLCLERVVDDTDQAWTHPRVRAALRRRAEVAVFTVPGALLTLGRGLAGRIEVSYEVEPDYRGQGLGRALAASARYLVGPEEIVWAQCAPGNAGSVRVLLAAGFVPVGSEVLLVPSEPGADGYAVR